MMWTEGERKGVLSGNVSPVLRFRRDNVGCMHLNLHRKKLRYMLWLCDLARDYISPYPFPAQKILRQGDLLLTERISQIEPVTYMLFVQIAYVQFSVNDMHFPRWLNCFVRLKIFA